MKKLLLILTLIIITFTFAQINRGPTDRSTAKTLGHNIFKKELFSKIQKIARSQFKYLPKRPGHYSAEDWRAVIDSTWGEGLPTEKKLQLFDYCWNLIDEVYPRFIHINVNWDSLRTIFRPEVAAGVSRGRFCAIMNYMANNLIDAHTAIMDVGVNYDSPKPGTQYL